MSLSNSPNPFANFFMESIIQAIGLLQNPWFAACNLAFFLWFNLSSVPFKDELNKLLFFGVFAGAFVFLILLILKVVDPFKKQDKRGWLGEFEAESKPLLWAVPIAFLLLCYLLAFLFVAFINLAFLSDQLFKLVCPFAGVCADSKLYAPFVALLLAFGIVNRSKIKRFIFVSG